MLLQSNLSDPTIKATTTDELQYARNHVSKECYDFEFMNMEKIEELNKQVIQPTSIPQEVGKDSNAQSISNFCLMR